MEAKARKHDTFEKCYANGGTLLEQKNAKKEDSAPTRKANEQASTAIELRRQMEYRQSMLGIENDVNLQVQRDFDRDTLNYYKAERDTRNNQRKMERAIER